MEAKTYRVKSISEALDKIREELGPDASVLHTRRIKQGLWNWLNGNRYEVVASNDVPVPDRFQQWMNESIDSVDEMIQEELDREPVVENEEVDPADAWKSGYQENVDAYDRHEIPSNRSGNLFEQGNTDEPGARSGRSLVSKPNESFEEFLGVNHVYNAQTQQIEMRSAFEDSMEHRGNAKNSSNGGTTSPEHRHGWEQLFAWLLSCGADSTAAHLLCADLKQMYAIARQDAASMIACPAWDELVSLLGSQIKRGGTIQNRPGRCQRVAMVGPTGVGKTTTIAKLAGEYKLRRGLQVGLITVDTFRVGAVDQLQAYAQIMKTPFAVVSDAAEMRAAVESMDHLDLVLIDTIGRSPSDLERLRNLQDVLRAADLDQTYLTVSAASSLASLDKAYRAYQTLIGTTQSSLILTKVDECSSLAGLYPFLKGCPLNWSYWTNGQEVPDDLGVAKDNVALWFLDLIQA